MSLTLRLKNACTIPISLKGIVPERLNGLSRSEIQQLPILCGNREKSLAELFEIVEDGEPDLELRIQGDLSVVSSIGHKMTCGSIQVTGNVGDHLGSLMTGGEIVVNGSAGDYAGAEMSGGRIEISDDADDWLGAAYSGSGIGVSGGTISVAGNVGASAGFRMRRGCVSIKGSCGSALGLEMRAGTIVAGGSIEHDCGRGMIRGTILLASESHARQNASLLPITFFRGGQFQPVFMNLIRRHIGDHEPIISPLPHYLYHGDQLKGGRGEIFLPST